MKQVKIKLLELKLRNFKGVEDFTLVTRGENVKIKGDNGTGKTTIDDAWHWLLFGKDSNDNSPQSFEIKTLDENNEPIHNIEHVVEGIIEVDGKEIKLKKSYYEKWEKQRGSAEERFTGHTTDHFYNGALKKEYEYKDKIADISDEKTFKMMTSPEYFSKQLHWEERRKILVDVCGDVTNEEVFESDDRLKELKDILNDTDIEEHKGAIKSQKTSINKEMKKIPIRIDEVTKGLPDINDIEAEKIEADIKVLKGDKKEKEAELSRVENGGQLAEKQKKLAELDTELEEIKRKHRSDFDKKISDKKAKLSSLKDNISELKSNIKSKKSDFKYNNNQVDKLNTAVDNLRKKWGQIDSKEFELDQDTTCPTCGQDIPHEHLQETFEKAQAEFNKKKSEQLEELIKEANDKKTDIEKLNDENKALEKEIKDLEDLAKVHQEEVEQITKEINDLQEEAEAYKENFKYKKKLTERQSVVKTIEKLKENNNESTTEIKQEINKLDNEISELQKELNKLDEYEKDQKRIQELSDQEKELAKKYDRLDKELFLIEEFTRKKVSMLEEKINSKFKLAKFKLFEEQVNGAVNEVCETLYNGIPYNGNLNSGHRDIVGIDIINTLSKYYKFVAPIFVDNAESVSVLPDTEAQIIQLIKPNAFKDLDPTTKADLIAKHGGYEEAERIWNARISELSVEYEDDDKAMKEAS